MLLEPLWANLVPAAALASACTHTHRSHVVSNGAKVEVFSVTCDGRWFTAQCVATTQQQQQHSNRINVEPSTT